LKDEKYYGSLDLNCTLDEVLESISLATPLSIIRQGDEIYITPEKSK
jgi:transmembrane sensor